MRKIALLSAAALVGLSVTTAYAGSITVTETGVLGYGTDSNNIFRVGGNLTGQTYRLTVTENPSFNVGTDGMMYNVGRDYSGTSTATLTINGFTDSFTGGYYAATYLERNLYPGYYPGSGYQLLQLFTYGNVSSAYAEATVYNPGITTILNSVDFNQAVSYNPISSDYQLAIFRDGNGVDALTEGGAYGFGGTVTNITLNGGTSVPEPLSLALIGSGLLGLGAFRRRKAKRGRAGTTSPNHV